MLVKQRRLKAASISRLSKTTIGYGGLT